MNRPSNDSNHPCNHRSNNDVRQLKALIQEMAKTVYFKEVPIGDHSDDPIQLRREILKMAMMITRLSDDIFLKAIVGSVFDTQSVDDTITELRAWNEGDRPKWLFKAG